MKELFYLENDRKHFWQWDINQRLKVEDDSITEVHFCNCSDENALIVEVVDGYANVPNILLQMPLDIKVYALCDCYTKVEKKFRVIARSKPSDYVYTETEVKNYEALESRITALEENGGGGGGNASALFFNVFRNEDTKEWESELPFDDIYNAILEKKLIICLWKRYSNQEPQRLYLSEFTDFYAEFSCVDGIQAYGFRITRNGISQTLITYVEHSALPKTLPNPYVLRLSVDGEEKIYDGSSAVEFKIKLPKPTSSLPWEAITNKPFGINYVDVINIDMPIFEANMSITEPIIHIEGGVEYEIEFGNQIYKQTAVEELFMNQLPSTILGNVDMLMGTGDNGMPFILLMLDEPMDDEGEMVYGMLAITDESYLEQTIKFRISSGDGTIKRIEEEYLELDNYAKLTDIPNTDTFALKTDIPDTTNFATKAEIPDVSSYQTAEQVQTAIEAYVGVIENGTY